MRIHLEKGCLWIAILTLTFPIRVPAAETTNRPSSTEAKLAGGAPAAARKIVYLQYRPPLRGAPSVRVTGSSRAQELDLSLSVLAPAHVGLTTKPQPSLFWYQSKPADASFELTLMEDEKPKPLLQVKVASAKRDGIQRLRLADHKVSLAFNVSYRWVVALVADPGNRSRDIVASGFIKRVAPPADLGAKLKKAEPTELPFLYAEEGIWYDALETLSNQIDAAPKDRVLRELRADLLSQVGLHQAASFDANLVAEK